ncbi:Rha family transcriptional regulator, partial [Klebsiella quasipneumoniae]
MKELSITTATMTSMDIAELIGNRHDKVKQSIERLVKRGVITSPPMGEKPTAGRSATFFVFSGEMGKRDSIIVVAQLSPEFTARLVDRWLELEKAVKEPALPRTYKEAL